MVFDTVQPSTVGTVECRLAFSMDGIAGWQWVEIDGLTGPQFIPHGTGKNAFDSHICFAAHSPAVMEDGSHRVYFMGVRALFDL